MALGRARLDVVPSLRLEVGDPCVGLAMDWMAGTAVEALPRSDARRREAHRSAGAVLRQLHALPVPSDGLSLESALDRRIESWQQRGAGLVETEIAEQVSKALGPELRPAIASAMGPRVWCHRDFEPRHWLLDHAGAIRVIDFGQARPDGWLWDLVKLAEGAWVDDPAARAAFLDGYRRPLEPEEDAALASLGALHGYQTLIWGLEHGAPRFADLGRRILTRRLTSA